MTGHVVIRPPARLRRRRLLAAAGVIAALTAVTLGTLSFGDSGITPGDSLRAVFGVGDPGTLLVVRGWRLPRAVLGMILGALLALSGALFQKVTRNPLGSPDVLGFSTGAFTGVLLTMTAGSVSVWALTASAFAGGLVATVIVLALTARGGARGFALIVTGIGVTAMLSAVNTVVVMRSDDLIARSAAIWATGSLNGVDGAWVGPATGMLVTTGFVTWLIRDRLALQEFGDDRASLVGARPGATRWIAMITGIAMLSMATAVSGPIAFIALAAPQIARRLWRTGTIPLAASALVGALLLCVSDLLSARLLAPAILPTGLVTLCLGGVYLAWMLTARERTSS